MPDLVTLDEVRRAAASLGPHLHRTPILGSRTLSELVGCEVLLKAELFQRTGSFKPRGAVHAIFRLPAENARRGLITISAGNMAQGLAFAARIAGVPATVVLPEGATPAKIAATRGYGAEVINGGPVGRAFELVERLRKERGLEFVHPFDNPALVAGHGTLGLEILEDQPDVDAVVVPIGGGGLIAGVAAALRGAGSRSRVRVYGVEPEGAAGMTRALEAGKPVRLESIDTVADGLAAPFVGELNLEQVRAQVEDVVLVSDDEIREAVLLLLERAKLLAEPAAAASVAALMAGKIPVRPGERVVAVLSGGNLNLDDFDRMLPARLHAAPGGL